MCGARAFVSCCGFIDLGVRCPFPGPRCRVHANGTYSVRIKKSALVLQPPPVCAVCLENPKTRWFKCKRHSYCEDCIIEGDVLDGLFDDCPFCQSEREMESID